MHAMQPSLRLWQLISPSLPIGGYSYSNALEQVVDAGMLRDDAAVREWIEDTLRYGLARSDLPILKRVHAAVAGGDVEAALRWSRELAAMRETAELRLADGSMGAALARLLGDVGASVPARDLPFAGAFAAAAAAWSIPCAEACAGFAWAWCESQVAAAVKLVPLGHTAGQRVLLALGPAVEAAVGEALALDDEDIGFSLPGIAIASALHETQYSRLFRS